MSEMELADTITEEAAGAEVGAEGGQPSAAVDEGTPGTEPVVEQPAAPSWTPDEVYAEAEQRAAAVAEQRFQDLLNQYAQQGQQQEQEPGFPEIDLFADDAVPQLLQAITGTLGQQIEQLLDSRLGPVLQRHENEQYSEASQREKDIIADLEATNGEYLSGDEARTAVSTLANVFVAQTAQRYGIGPRAAEAALAQADKIVRSIETAADKRGYTRAETEIAGLGGARREPAGSGSGAVVALESYGSEADFAEAYMARLGQS